LQAIKKKAIIQIIWGKMLIAMGVCIIYNIPQKIAEIQKTDLFSSNLLFLKFFFYFLAILLIGGGIKKNITNYRKLYCNIKKNN